MAKIRFRSFSRRSVYLAAVCLGLASAFAPVAPVSARPSRAALTQTAASTFFFRDGDRAVILGDSITEQQMYSNLIESYVLSRFPKWRITFRNVGWGGDTAGLRNRGGQENGLKRDVLPLHPTAVLIDFGMNDVRDGEAGYTKYVADSQKLVQSLKAAGSRVALVTSSAEEGYDPNEPGGSPFNRTLMRYSLGLRGVAREEKIPFVNQLEPMILDIESGRKVGILGATADGPRLVPDGVHPNWAGHFVMATHILKGLNAPALVSSVEIDARKKRVTSAQGAQVGELSARKVKSKGKVLPRLSFVRQDAALPWPFPAEIALALGIPDFNPLQDLSNFELKVNGLPDAKYDLTIDGRSTGQWTSSQLAGGLNLSIAAGPIYDQGEKLFAKIGEKNNLFHHRWREVQVAPEPSTETEKAARNAELARLDAEIAAIEKEIDILRQPVPHQWTLTPIID